MDKNLTYEEKQALKTKYIPMCVEGKLSIRKCAAILGLSAVTVFNLKKRYIEKGDLAFVNGHKGLDYQQKKYSDELRTKILDIYKELYSEKNYENVKDFQRILKTKYQIEITYAILRKLLNLQQEHAPRLQKYIRVKDVDASDFNMYFKILTKYIENNELNQLENFGIVQICSLTFDKANLVLRKMILKKTNVKIRTSFSLFNYIIENKMIDIEEEWNYWLENHKGFSFIYDEQILSKVVADVKSMYFPMMKKIHDFIASDI